MDKMPDIISRNYLSFIDRVNNHFKFYYIYGFDDYSMVIIYGRIGTKGVATRKTFSSERALNREISTKIAEKERKGYTADGKVPTKFRKDSWIHEYQDVLRALTKTAPKHEFVETFLGQIIADLFDSDPTVISVTEKAIKQNNKDLLIDHLHSVILSLGCTEDKQNVKAVIDSWWNLMGVFRQAGTTAITFPK